MIESVAREVILSIETAVGGGSLSILARRADSSDKTEIDGWRGALEISKAEDVLEQVAELLEKNNIAGNQIKLISVSKDVGSLTGRKIGLALAKGLSKSLKCDLIEISALEALLLEIKETLDGEYITALSSGANSIWWQIFRISNNTYLKETSSSQMSSREQFYKLIEHGNFKRLAFYSDDLTLHRTLHRLLNERHEKLINSESSLANLIGLKVYS